MENDQGHYHLCAARSSVPGAGDHSSASPLESSVIDANRIHEALTSADPGVGRPSGYGVAGRGSLGSALHRPGYRSSQVAGQIRRVRRVLPCWRRVAGHRSGPGPRDRGCAAGTPAAGQGAG
jgi:hypothetical protein